jgi:hypothetical protein
MASEALVLPSDERRRLQCGYKPFFRGLPWGSHLMLEAADGDDGVGCRTRGSHFRTLLASCAMTLLLLQWSRRLQGAAAGARFPLQELQLELPPLPASSFSWKEGQWGECSLTCGTGAKMRVVRCADQLDVSQPSSKCHGPEPTTQEFCNVANCPVTARPTAASVAGLSPEGRPSSPPDVPAASASLTARHFRWNMGPWSECSVTCGGGIQGANQDALHAQAFAAWVVSGALQLRLHFVSTRPPAKLPCPPSALSSRRARCT